MYRSVSALILCGTLGLAFAPDVAAAKNAVCVRTSLGAVVCGQTVAHREALPKQRYVTRQAVPKHSWASRDHTSRYADEGPASTKDYRGHSQVRHYERAGSDYFHKTGHQATITDPAKRARVHQALYGDRPIKSPAASAASRSTPITATSRSSASLRAPLMSSRTRKRAGVIRASRSMRPSAARTTSSTGRLATDKPSASARARTSIRTTPRSLPRAVIKWMIVPARASRISPTGIDRGKARLRRAALHRSWFA